MTDDDQRSPNNHDSEDDSDLNENLDSQEASEVSHDATKKNLFIQENILQAEEGAIEEVREFDEESDSKEDSERKNSIQELTS